MQLGLFFMPVHDHAKPWAQALAEDREAVILADRLGFSEAWMGEHFSTSAERVPAPLMFFASLIDATEHIRFGTGVVNLGHRHPVVVAAEAAQFDQLSGGRLILGVGPGGLNSDAELFGRPDPLERQRLAAESIDMIQQLWSAQPPFDLQGEFWSASLAREIWPSHGVGELPRPLQDPHPPMAMAMVSPGGATAEMIASRSFIPISANFVPVDFLVGQWASYSQTRRDLGLDVDRSIWRVCRNILITESQAEADEVVADPDGVFAHYFRYLRGVGKVTSFDQNLDNHELNGVLGVDRALDSCVIAGTVDHVTERLVAMADTLGRFGTLIMVGHDWDDSGRWPRSMHYLAEQVGPKVGQHVDSLPDD